MTASLIAHIFNELLKIGLCRSRSDFSTDWLGREQSYYRTVVSRNGQVSIAAQACLAAHLESTATAFGNYDFPSIAQKARIAKDLYARCLDDLLLWAIYDAQVTGREIRDQRNVESLNSR